MNVKEAYAILKKNAPELDSNECYEYESLFVFNVHSIRTKNVKKIQPRMGNLISVDKKRGNLRTFNPFDIPIEEYLKGKKITSFKK